MCIRDRGYAFSPDTVWQQEFEQAFAFEETQGQLQSVEEIKRDMESPRIMDRLLCGDVGWENRGGDARCLQMRHGRQAGHEMCIRDSCTPE